MEGVPDPLQTSECKSDSNSFYNDESKLWVKDEINYFENSLLENDLALESSGKIFHEELQIGEDLAESTIDIQDDKTFVKTEELFLLQEDSDARCEFHETEDDDSDQYMLPGEEKTLEYIPLEYKIKVVNLAKEHPKWSLKTLQKNGCSRLKSMKLLYRWKEDIKRGGTRIDKYTAIDSWTYDRFVEACRANHQQVTTRDLQQWALTAANKFKDFSFKASKRWVWKFKKKHKIKQRKYTKDVTAIETAAMDIKK